MVIIENLENDAKYKKKKKNQSGSQYLEVTLQLLTVFL